MPRRKGPPHPKCGRPCSTKNGEPCENAAGQRTDHVGTGACWKHGGNGGRPRRYGDIKSERLQELSAKHEADENPLDLLPDLALLRTLIEDYVDRYDEFTTALIDWHDSFLDPEKASPKPMRIVDISSAGGLIGQIATLVGRIQKQQEQGAITMETLVETIRDYARGVAVAIAEIISDDDLRTKLLTAIEQRTGNIQVGAKRKSVS